MPITAISADGNRHVFPDGTDGAVVDRVMKDYAAKNVSGLQRMGDVLGKGAQEVERGVKALPGTLASVADDKTGAIEPAPALDPSKRGRAQLPTTAAMQSDPAFEAREHRAEQLEENVGDIQGGTLRMATSPIGLASPAIERTTGIPKEVTEGVGGALVPFVGPTALRAAGRGVARMVPETLAPKAPTLAELRGKGEGTPGVPNVAARGNTQAAQKLAAVTEALEKAEKAPLTKRQDAIKSEVQKLLDDPEKGKLFTDAERKQAQRVIDGTLVGNIGDLPRTIAEKLGINPAVAHLMGAVATHGASLWPSLGLNVAGEAIGLGSTRRQGSILQDIVARESPLAKSRKPEANPAREYLDKLFPPFGGKPQPDYRLGGGGSARVPPGPDAPGVGVEKRNVHGLMPELRVLAPDATIPDKPLFTAATNNKNAAAQIANLDTVAQRFPSPGESAGTWSNMMAYSLGSRDVPLPPYNLFTDINEGGAVAKLRNQTPGQIADADHGFATAREMLAALHSGEMKAPDTAKLFLWGFMSRRLSPYVQEASFLDAFEGIEPWLERSLAGKFTAADIPAYKAWVDTVLQKGSGLPGVGAKNNMWDFGNFLEKMGQPVEEGGVTRLQRMHDLMADPTKTGPQIRREFAKMSEGVGMDNKIMSFILLVSGRDDVMILDRVQFDALWNDGRFGDRNLYEGEKVKSKASGKSQTKTGTTIAELGNGVRGLVVYEALERALGAKVKEIYTQLGRPQDASIGRYHWDTWVAHSQQEASHGSITAIMRQVRRENAPAANIMSKQGEYGAYEYGAQYGRDEEGTSFFRYKTPLYGNLYEFSVPAFRDFLEAVKRPATGVVPTGFKVTEAGNGPWYRNRRVNQQRLDETAARFADRSGGAGASREGAGAVRQAEPDQVADGPRPGRGQPAVVGLGAVADIQPPLTQ